MVESKFQQFYYLFKFMYNLGVHCLSFPISIKMSNVQVCGAPLYLETSLVKVCPSFKEVQKICI